MGVDIEAARMLTWRAAATLDDDGFPLTLPTTMAKLFASEIVQRVTRAGPGWDFTATTAIPKAFR